MGNSTKRKPIQKPVRKKKNWRPSLFTITLILCNLFQAALLCWNFFVLNFQRDIIRYLFVQAFTKNQ